MPVFLINLINPLHPPRICPSINPQPIPHLRRQRLFRLLTKPRSPINLTSQERCIICAEQQRAILIFGNILAGSVPYATFHAYNRSRFGFEGLEHRFSVFRDIRAGSPFVGAGNKERGAVFEGDVGQTPKRRSMMKYRKMADIVWDRQ